MKIGYLKDHTQGTTADQIFEYLLNHRVEEGTAKTLSGNPKLTLSIIKEAEKKTEVVLEFGSSNICRDTRPQQHK